MERVRRAATATLLLLLAVTFGPLLCRVGGAQPAPAAGTAVAQAAAVTPPAAVIPAASAGRGTPDRAPSGSGTPERAAAERTEAGPAAGVPVAEGTKKCSRQHAPGQNESVPVPTPNRGEPSAPAATGPAPLAADGPACFALARPPTGTAPATDHTALLPVLRI
ncbi:hypothetical protein [Streptomyces sp. NPDC017529]|uniref:hypothetical protein n=1 Tax=Streptomyces sp. NPDC017529 TaxID=3365000 RepID=UPI00378F9FCD